MADAEPPPDLTLARLPSSSLQDAALAHLLPDSLALTARGTARTMANVIHDSFRVSSLYSFVPDAVRHYETLLEVLYGMARDLGGELTCIVEAPPGLPSSAAGSVVPFERHNSNSSDAPNSNYKPRPKSSEPRPTSYCVLCPTQAYLVQTPTATLVPSRANRLPLPENLVPTPMASLVLSQATPAPAPSRANRAPRPRASVTRSSQPTPNKTKVDGQSTFGGHNTHVIKHLCLKAGQPSAALPLNR